MFSACSAARRARWRTSRPICSCPPCPVPDPAPCRSGGRPWPLTDPGAEADAPGSSPHLISGEPTDPIV
ncbi:hypothetical protein DKG71_07015 [Streptomyces sp. NEAU-S7GS2]|nr:hypothetical protein DKG71_07015 [Streptomyces sp. NEAU-S7GS2]